MQAAHVKTRTTFQAGYAQPQQNIWTSCGRGSTPEKARDALKENLHARGLQWVASYFKHNPEHPSSNKLVAALYDQGIKYATDGIYTETSFEEGVL